MSKFNKVYIASDHAGFALKTFLIEQLKSIPLVDLGCPNESSVDYPDFADLVAQKICNDDNALGILVCGSGQGMAIRANRYQKVRAALCLNEEMAQLAREHNCANIICLGGRMIMPESAVKIVQKFLATEFAGGRHSQRVEKLNSKTSC